MEKAEMSVEKKAEIAVKIVAILREEAGGYEFDVLHTVASLLNTGIKVIPAIS
jgi:hypothetical protein